MVKIFEQLLAGMGNTPEKEPESTVEVEGEKRALGKIIKVSDEGWGFISSKDIKFTRIFFHWTSLRQDTLKFPDLRNGMKVEFTPKEMDGKGWRATRIRVIETNGSKK